MIFMILYLDVKKEGESHENYLFSPPWSNIF